MTDRDQRQRVLDYSARLRRKLAAGEAPEPASRPRRDRREPSGRIEVGRSSSDRLPVLERQRTYEAPAAPPETTAAPPAEPAPLPEAEAPAAAAEPAPASDGTIRQVLTARSRTTTLKDLSKQGLNRVQVLGMSTVERIVREAVDTAIARSDLQPSAAQREEIEADAREEMARLIADHRRTLAEKEQIEARRQELEARLGQLEATRVELREEQARSGPVLSADDLAAQKATFAQLLDEFMTAERRQALAAGSTDELLGGLDALETQLGEVFDRVVGRARSENEELLERRLKKLNGALAETEGALRKLAAAKSIDPGVASVFDVVQGLSDAEEDYERKKELLSIVFVTNLELQGRDVTEDDRALLEQAEANLEAHRVADADELELPAGFSAPTDAELVDEVAF